MLDSLQNIPVGQLVAGATGGVLGAFITQLLISLRNWRERSREAYVSALLLALHLENYASDCCDPIDSHVNYADSGQQTREPSGALPRLVDYPDQTNWRSLGRRTATEVLGFRVKVAVAASEVAWTWEHEGSQLAWSMASDKAIELGSLAVAMSRRLRKRFKLGDMEREAAEIAAYFDRKLKELEENRRRYQARLAATPADEI